MAESRLTQAQSNISGTGMQPRRHASTQDRLTIALSRWRSSRPPWLPTGLKASREPLAASGPVEVFWAVSMHKSAFQPAV